MSYRNANRRERIPSSIMDPSSTAYYEKNVGIPERKWRLHSSDNCFGKRPNQEIARDGLGGDPGNRADTVKY